MSNPLLEHAAQNPQKSGPPCATCGLPEAETINEAKRLGGRKIGGTAVRKWLIAECGYTDETAPTDKAIGSHFYNKHHEETT